MSQYTAKVRARANIALSKYWGKSDVALNLPAVPSISLTLDPMCTDTTVTFDASFDSDTLFLNGEPAKDKALKRAVKVLDQVRGLAKLDLKARVESVNNFPTASGLASSASGFAALVAAACSAAGLPRDNDQWSAMSRQASASAARSIYGGFVELPKGVPGNAKLCAKQIEPSGKWDVRIVVAVANEGPKAMGSTEGMTLSEQTSPYYKAWVDCSDALCAQVREGILQKDLVKVGEAMEQSTLAMHACMMASHPGLIYFEPVTLAALATVRKLRKAPSDGGQSIPVYATMDAGPHVKALCLAEHVDAVVAALQATPGVLRTIVASPGPDLELNPHTPQPVIPRPEARK